VRSLSGSVAVLKETLYGPVLPTTASASRSRPASPARGAAASGEHQGALGAVLCCAVLCCAVLCCAVLCCAVLCCAVSQLLLCQPVSAIMWAIAMICV